MAQQLELGKEVTMHRLKLYPPHHLKGLMFFEYFDVAMDFAVYLRHHLDDGPALIQIEAGADPLVKFISLQIDGEYQYIGEIEERTHTIYPPDIEED